MPVNERTQGQGPRADWLEVAALLKSAYEKKKRGNKGFSLGVVARRLEVSVPFLSQLLGGKRSLPVSKVDAICNALDLDAEKRDYLYRRLLGKTSKSPLAQLGGPPSAGDAPSSAAWAYPPASAFWLLEDWTYLPLLNCTLLPAYDGRPSTLAAWMGLPLAKVELALVKLQSAGFLEDSGGILRKAARLNDFHSAASKEQIRAYHQEGLRRASAELTERTGADDLERRLITTLSLTVAEEHVGWAKQKLADFLRQLTEELTAPEGSSVYHLGVQFFPVTRG